MAIPSSAALRPAIAERAALPAKTMPTSIAIQTGTASGLSMATAPTATAPSTTMAITPSALARAIQARCCRATSSGSMPA